ncbi:uncharacterized protein LOC123312090 isoform X2 [Coccinella septempunctata]|nr:uncharacterized protein LOC123312090 isoform X2 [Coccinella septempunctata]XP_044752255.1 uncharacterized protein LOC123312090 isoform X2 [Coccinella septempunctata]
MKRGNNWTKAINNLCPSKFDLFIQKELNKCAGKNFDVKSFKINAKQETSSTSNDQVCSSAAIGYYTITTYDNALQCQNPNISNRKGRKLSTKQCNFIGFREETSVCPKKLYSKGLQCKLSNHHQQKKGKISPTKDLGVQCFYASKGEPKKDCVDERIGDVRTQNKKTPLPRQRNLSPKKITRKRHGSLSDLFPPPESKNVGNLIQINSSAEIRRILNDESDSSLTLSNTGEYFRTYLSPRPLMTYYQTSSTSKDNRGDTNDERYARNQPIVRVMAAANNKQFSHVDAIIVTAQSNHTSPVCSVHCKKNEIIKQCDCTYESTKHKNQGQDSFNQPLVRTVCSSKCTGPCSAARKTAATLTCPSDCPCPGQRYVERRNPMIPCVCPPPPRKACCECNKEVSAACICDLLCNLRERIKKQTEVQNRNLDQILEELDKQDKEIQLIRQFVEKSKKKKKYKCCAKKNAVCSCYAATVQYDFNSSPPVGAAEVFEENEADECVLPEVDEMNEEEEPEIIQIFGSKNKPEMKNEQALEKESWKALWKKNSRGPFANEFFKKKNNIRKKCSSSSNGPDENSQSRENKKDNKYNKWFSKLVCSKKDLRKNVS